VSGGDWQDLERIELERRHREACELLLASQEELARVSSAHEKALREVESAHADVEMSRDDLRGAELELQALRDELTVRDGQLADVVGSASWRLTEPLRLLKARIREPRQ
jgi:chromosome segregation ATPase